MKKGIILTTVILIILGILTFVIINNNFCFDKTHRGVYPVNPYCSKCHGRDGITVHECTNPNGKDKYCSVCGKIEV